MDFMRAGRLIDSFDGWHRDFAASKTARASHIQLRMILIWITRRAMLGDLVKSGTWAVLQMMLGFAVGYAVTGSAGFAAGIALLGGSLGSFAYWLHERLWQVLGRLRAHARR
jgi:uncharacterized membrane protein